MKLKLIVSIFLCVASLHAQETNLGGSASGGGTDATLTLTDITTNNASTSKHGFLPKLDGNSAHFLNGTGAFAAPASTDLTAPGPIGSVTPSTVKSTQYQATQSGSTAAGTPLTALQLTPASSGASKFVFTLGGANFGGVEDSVAYFGWNMASGDNLLTAGRSSNGINFEDEYLDGSVSTGEQYLSFRDTTAAYNVRPIFFQMRRTPGANDALVRQSYIVASKDHGLEIMRQLDPASNALTDVAAFNDGSTEFYGSSAATTPLFKINYAGGEPQFKVQKSGVTRWEFVSSGATVGSFQWGGNEAIRFNTSSTQRRTVFGGDTGLSLGVASVDMTNSAATSLGLHVVAGVTRTLDMARFNAQDATKFLRVNKDGYLGIFNNSAPADGDVTTSEVMPWFDNTNSTAKVVFKGKQADGTVVNNIGADQIIGLGSGVQIKAITSGQNITLSTAGTGNVIAPDGTAAHPSVSFASDTTSGWYRVGASGRFAFSIVTTPALFLNDFNANVAVPKNYALGFSGTNNDATATLGVRWSVGTGSPESVVTAPIGSLYSRTDGGAATTLYVKESGSGNTGWIAK